MFQRQEHHLVATSDEEVNITIGLTANVDIAHQAVDGVSVDPTVKVSFDPAAAGHDFDDDPIVVHWNIVDLDDLIGALTVARDKANELHDRFKED